MVDFLRDRDYRLALYRQTVMEVNGLRLRRFIQIADLKYCHIASTGSVTGEENARMIMYEEDFNREFERAIKLFERVGREKCGMPSMPEVYATLAWYLDNGVASGITFKMNEERNYEYLRPIAYDLVLDFDVDENPWLPRDIAFDRLRMIGKEVLNVTGVEPIITIGSGVQVKATLVPAWLGNGVLDRLVTPEEMGRVIELVAEEIARRLERLGVYIVYDKIYDRARVTRLDLSLHMGLTAAQKRPVFAIPFRLDQLEGLTWEKVRRLQSNIGFVLQLAREHPGAWGVVRDVGLARNIIGVKLEEALYNPPQFLVATGAVGNAKPRVVSTADTRAGGGGTSEPCPELPGGCKSIVVPGLGRVVYWEGLDKFGWAEKIIKYRVVLPDGKKNFLWAVVPALLNGARTRDGTIVTFGITENDVIEWIKANSINLGVSEHEYLKKFLSSRKYRYNIPTWEHLLRGVGADGKPLAGVYQTLREVIIQVFERLGWVRIEPDANDQG